MAEQNFHAAMRMTMPQIVRQYLRTFDWHRHSRFSSRARFSRIHPAWSAFPAHLGLVSPALVPRVASSHPADKSKPLAA